MGPKKMKQSKKHEKIPFLHKTWIDNQSLFLLTGGDESTLNEVLFNINFGTQLQSYCGENLTSIPRCAENIFKKSVKPNCLSDIPLHCARFKLKLNSNLPLRII